MATLMDKNPTLQPPTFVKMTGRGTTYRALLAQGHGVKDDLSGRWFCDIQSADGIRATRDIDIPQGRANEVLIDTVAKVRSVALAKRAQDLRPAWLGLLGVKGIGYSLWSLNDDLTRLKDPDHNHSIIFFGQELNIKIKNANGRRHFLGLFSDAGSTINNIFSNESYELEFVSTNKGALPVLRHVPKWSLADAYWSFLRDGYAEAAEATGSVLLKEIHQYKTGEISDHILVAAAHASLNFPWLADIGNRIDIILAENSSKLVDIQILDWARSFDRDPVDSDVFNEKLVRLLNRLSKEPPAYAKTGLILMERLRTAVAERDRMRQIRDEVAWSIIRTVRTFVAATLPGRDQLVFEGMAPLLPEKHVTFGSTGKKSFTRTENLGLHK